MHWKTRQRQIAEMKLRNKGCKYRVPLPDLSFEARGAPLSNSIPGGIAAQRRLAAGSNTFAVGHSHKQGLELITPATAKSDLKGMGGVKT